MGDAEQLFDNGEYDGHAEEHAYRRVACLSVTTNKIAYEIAWSQQQLEEGVGHGSGIHTPKVHDACPDPSPGDASVTGFLAADGAVVPLEFMTAVGATVSVRVPVGVAGGFFLPCAEAAILLNELHGPKGLEYQAEQNP